jgi:hypothetical protein
MWLHMVLVRDLSEEYTASIMRMKRISELGTTLAITTANVLPRSLNF